MIPWGIARISANCRDLTAIALELGMGCLAEGQSPKPVTMHLEPINFAFSYDRAVENIQFDCYQSTHNWSIQKIPNTLTSSALGIIWVGLSGLEPPTSTMST